MCVVLDDDDRYLKAAKCRGTTVRAVEESKCGSCRKREGMTNLSTRSESVEEGVEKCVPCLCHNGGDF